MVARLKIISQAFYPSKVLLLWGVGEGSSKLSNKAARRGGFLFVVYLFKRKFKTYFCPIPSVIQGNREETSVIPPPTLFPGLQTSHFYGGPPRLWAMKVGTVCLGLALHTGFSSWGGMSSELVLLGSGSQLGLFKVWGLVGLRISLPQILNQVRSVPRRKPGSYECWQLCVQLDASLGPCLYLFILIFELILFISILLS